MVTPSYKLYGGGRCLEFVGRSARLKKLQWKNSTVKLGNGEFDSLSLTVEFFDLRINFFLQVHFNLQTSRLAKSGKTTIWSATNI